MGVDEVERVSMWWSARKPYVLLKVSKVRLIFNNPCVFEHLTKFCGWESLCFMCKNKDGYVEQIYSYSSREKEKRK